MAETAMTDSENGGIKEGEVGFKDHPVPSWRDQLTVRALFTSAILSVVFSFIVMKLNLTTGVIPSLNVAAGLLGFAIVKAWTMLLQSFGLLKQPFTRQENTVIQTAVVASSGIAFSSGMASYLLGMTSKIAAQGGGISTPINVKGLSLGWMIGFLFIVSFAGLFSITPLRRVMITKYKLTYPSGTATAMLINSFHTPKGAKLAKKQIGLLMKSFSFSFVFAGFQWFYTAADNCGFGSFPTFGPQAYARRFYFDFSSTYVGVGMICPYMVNISLLIGAVLSWGILWPVIESKEGHWYAAGLSTRSLHGLQGYQVFLAIAMMFGDGIFHVVYMMAKTLIGLWKQYYNTNNTTGAEAAEEASLPEEERRQIEFFEKDQIPDWFAFLGYFIIVVVAAIAVPRIFPQLSWYHLVVAYLIAPILAFCNAYGAGLSDWSLASNYGKIAIIIFSAWVGDDGGIIAGLAACGVMMNIVSTASDLMQDFKTGYLTLSSPRSMFVSQIFGTAISCVITPLVFWFFYKAYPVGDSTGSYPAPYAVLYRGIALLGVEGISSLPRHCLALSIIFFFAAILMNAVQELLRHYKPEWGVHKYIPSPMCMAIPFYLGGYFAIDMCLGSLILYIWQRINKQKAKDYAPAMASGLICGESLWSVPAALLALGGVQAPMCMKFLTSSVNDKVDAFIRRNHLQ